MRRAVALVLTAIMMVATAATIPGEAYGAECPKGYVWVEAPKIGADGKDINGWGMIRSGRCVKQTPAEEDVPPAGGGADGSCIAASDLDTGMPGACPDGAHMVADLPALARSLAVRLRLPPATPVFGPDPNDNEWKMLAVGFPVWLWTGGPRERSATASAQGLTFRLRASLRSTTFAMGDGKQLTCTTMTTYTNSVKPGSKSPTCGYVYTQPSPLKGAYTVTAAANWQISWSVDGFSGSFPYSYSDSASIRIGELAALNR